MDEVKKDAVVQSCSFAVSCSIGEMVAAVARAAAVVGVIAMQGCANAAWKEIETTVVVLVAVTAAVADGKCIDAAECKCDYAGQQQQPLREE